MKKMLRIGFPVIAIAIGMAASAFTVSRPMVKSGDNLYGVTGSDATHYFVTDITGQTPDVDYTCMSSQNQCTVIANPSDVSSGVVLKSKATVQNTGTFQSLQ